LNVNIDALFNVQAAVFDIVMCHPLVPVIVLETSNCSCGAVVPIPTLPACVILTLSDSNVSVAFVFVENTIYQAAPAVPLLVTGADIAA
jgi:hypothetical protein